MLSWRVTDDGTAPVIRPYKTPRNTAAKSATSRVIGIVLAAVAVHGQTLHDVDRQVVRGSSGAGVEL